MDAAGRLTATMAVPFEEVLVALVDAGARFLVTGGMALVLHGHADRPVADLDVVIDASSPENVDRVARCLSSLGFVQTVALPLSFVIVMRWLDGAGREVDVNIRYPIAWADLAPRARQVPVAGRLVPVIAPEDLLTVKSARGRDYDVGDAAWLRETFGIR